MVTAIVVLSVLLAAAISAIVVLLRRPKVITVPGKPLPAPAPAPVPVPVPVPRPLPPPHVIPVPAIVGAPSGGPPVEPKQLPKGEDLVADSTVDGARVGDLVVRAGSVRGDDHRRRGMCRRDAFLIELGPGGTGTGVLISLVAAGNPHGDRSQRMAREACDSTRSNLLVLLPRLTACWWRGDTAAVRQELDQVQSAVVRHLRLVMQPWADAPDADRSVELTGLITELGDVGHARRHLAFGIGGGEVLVRSGTTFVRPLGEQAAHNGASLLPDVNAPLRTATFTSTPGNLVVLATAATAGYVLNPTGAEFFLREWQRPRELVEFLWQLSARTTGTGPDRTAVCIWDTSSHR